MDIFPSNMEALTEQRGARQHAKILWLLTTLFLIRVLCQATQRWMPISYLPAFDAFQGSALPYWTLLSAQLLILALMLKYSWRVQSDTLRTDPATGHVLHWLGWIYLLLSLGRILIGVALPSAPAWFSAWIPASLHVALAGYVLTLASFHLRPFRSGITK